MNAPGGEFDRLLRRLAGRRALARSAILFERVWPALWPPLGVAGAVHLRRAARPAAPAAAVVAYRPARGHRVADPRAAGARAADHRRAGRQGGRPPPGGCLRAAHRPLAVLTDRPSRGTPRTRYGVGRALAGACRARGALGAPAARRPAAPRAGAARSACAARGAGGRPGRRLRDRRRRCALAAGAGDGADAAARHSAAGHRVAGLDHAARAIRGWRRSSSSRTAARCRCRPAPASPSA